MGEGAGRQDYGWGLYFSDVEEYARGYADRARTADSIQDDIERLRAGIQTANARLAEAQAVRDAMNADGYWENNEQYQEALRNGPSSARFAITRRRYENATNEEYAEAVKNSIVEGADRNIRMEESSIHDMQRRLSEAENTSPQTRNLYTVELPDNARWLDINETVPRSLISAVMRISAVRQGIMDNWGSLEDYRNAMLGSSAMGFYNDLAMIVGSDREASLILNRAGITGFRYPADGIAERAGTGPYNYVVFNPSDAVIRSHELYQTIDEDAIRQPLNENTYEAAIELASVAHPQFAGIIEEIRNLTGADDNDVSIRRAFKGKARSIEKAISDYSGDFSRILDYDGAMIRYSDLADAENAWNTVKERYADRIVKEKHLSTPLGYQDFKVNIRMDNGSIAEIQFLDKNTLSVKNGIGHKLYEISRRIDSLENQGVRNLQDIQEAITAWSRYEYANGYLDGVTSQGRDSARDSASSREIMQALVSALSQNHSLSALLNARSEMVLPSGEITTETGEALLDSILYGLSLISTNLNSSATTASNQSINEQRGGVNGSLFQTIDDDWIVEEIQDDITDDGSVSRDSMNANDAQAIEDTLQSLIRIAFEYTDYDEYREVAEWSYFAEDEIIDKAWNIAKNPNGDGTGNSAAPSKTLASPDTSASSEEAKDREFSEIISTDAGFDEWLEAIQIALRDADTEGQRAVYEAIEARHLIAPLIEALLHPSENQQYLKTRQSQARSRASAKGILKASPAFYRDLYAKATDSEFWTSLYADSIPEELMALPEEDAASLSISARKRLAEDIRDENLKNAILSGNEVFGEEGVSESLKRVLDKEEEAIRKGEADLAALRDEYKRLRDRYTTQSIEKNNLWKKVIELDEQIDRAEKRLHTISERIAASSRADFGEDGNNPAQRNIDIQSRLSSQISQLISQHNSYLRQLRNEGIRNAVSETRNTERQRANARVENARERGRQAVSDQYQRDLERMRKIRADRDNKLRELREHYKGKEALRRVEAYKRRLMDSIMRPASSGVDVEYGRKVAAIQALIDPENRKYIRIDNKTWDINLLKKMFRGEVERDPAVFDSLTESQLDRLSKKSRDEFTVNELLSLKTAIDQLRDEGRTAWKLRKTAERKAIQQYRDKVMATLLGLKNYREAPPSGSGEERDLNRSLWDRVKSIYRDTINMAKKSQMLDGGKKGVFYHLLAAMKRDAQAQEFRMVVERMKPIRDYISEHKIDSSRFYNSYKVAFDGKEAEYRYTDLAYIYLSKNNIRNRNAVAYGVLVSETEKFNIANAVDSEMPGAGRQAEDNRRKEVNKRITELGDRRYNELYSQAENIVKSSDNSDLFEVVRLIEQDFNSDLFQRLVDAMRNTYNIAVEKEDYYLPINRTDFAGSEPGETIKQDLLNMIPGEGAVQRGFTKSRLDISPRQQKAINIDLFGVWQNSVEAQEHALANMDYVRLLKGVFVNHGSEAIRSAITSTFGKNMMRDIENHINMIANPRSFQKVDQGANQILRFFRGSLYSSYLGWRTSSLITQAVTSPMPFLGAVNPVELLQGAFTVFSHPVETWNEIQRLSPFMANRSQHPIVEWIKEESERADLPRARRIYAKFQNMGMQGLEYVDRYSVAIGWWAIYQKERNRILNSDAQMTEAELERAAAKVADEYVQETQPQSDITELSPLFQNRSEALQALTQFQSSLNVIWQNITYDIPQAFRNHQYARAWGMISGYIVAGVLLYLIQDGFDDDDDEKDKARKLAYAATTQITSGVPLISDYVDNALQQVITGESDGLFNSQSFPAIDKFFRAAANASKGNWENAYRQFFDSVMLFTGAPYSLLNDIEKMTGNFGQDEDASFHPEVLIGKDPE